MKSTASNEDIGQEQSYSGRYLWVVLFLFIGTELTQALLRMGLPVLYPFIQNELGLSRGQVGLLTSAFAFGYGASSVPAGWFTDTIGVKQIVVIYMFSMAAFTLAFPLVNSFTVILVLVAIIAIVSSPVHNAAVRGVMDWFPTKIRASAMSVNKAGPPIAGTLTAAILPALALAIGWRMAAAANGLLILSIVIIFILLYRDAPARIQVEHKFNIFKSGIVFRNRGLMLALIWATTFVGLQFTVMTYFMLFLIEKLNLSVMMAGSLLAIAQGSSIIARVLWGAASDFIFHGRRIVVLVIIGLITVVWMLGASLLSVEVPRILLYLMALVIGISTISFQGVTTTLIGEQAPEGQIGVTVGFFSMVSHASMMVMPPIFGYLVDVTNSYSFGWGVTAVLALVVTLSLMALGRLPQRR